MSSKLARKARVDALMCRLYAGCRPDPRDTITAKRITLRLTGEIGPSRPINARRVAAALAKYPTAETEIVIDSPGGNLTEAERIASAIAAHGGFTIATVKGECSSAAIHILLSCQFRQCQTQSRFVLHRVAIDSNKSERWTAERHRKTAATLDRFDRKLVDHYHRSTGRPKSDFEREIATETAIDPAAACRLGLVHAYEHNVRWAGGKPSAPPIQARLGYLSDTPGRCGHGRIGAIF